MSKIKQTKNRQQVVGNDERAMLEKRAQQIEKELSELPMNKTDFNKQYCSKHGHVFKITQYHFLGNLANSSLDGGFHGNYSVNEVCLCCGEERNFLIAMSLEQVGNTFQDKNSISAFRRWRMKKAEEGIVKKRLELSKELEDIRLRLKNL